MARRVEKETKWRLAPVRASDDDISSASSSSRPHKQWRLMPSVLVLLLVVPVSSFPSAGIRHRRSFFPVTAGTMMARTSRWTIRDEDIFDDIQLQQNQEQLRTIPPMPSQLFRELAQSQLELLATSLTAATTSSRRTPSSTKTKVRSMALYLPQENQETGQLQFIPAVLYPHPDSDRVFIAPESDSRGLTLPNVLSKLPGFAHASTLIPNYPMVSGSSDAGIGAVEEVLCDIQSKNGAAALSVPLFSGSQTVGVILVSPDDRFIKDSQKFWCDSDRQKVAQAAQSLSLALSMDMERMLLAQKNKLIQEALSDSLHQLKNPVQALRTYGKLLQQRIANSEQSNRGRTSFQLLELVNHLMVQSDRVVDRLGPVDSIVEALSSEPSRPMYALGPARIHRPKTVSIVPWSPTAAWGSATKDSWRSDTDMTHPQSESEGMLFELEEDVNLEMGFIDDVTSETISAFRAIASVAGIDFTVDIQDELPGVLMNPDAIQEIVSNILDNAFKYVVLPKHGLDSNQYPRVRIRLLANKPPIPSGVTILVEDNGPGICPSDYMAVFDRGFRGASTRSEVTGSGIGLDIVQALVHKMKGTIRVVPKSNGDNRTTYDGTVMELRLFRSPR